MENTQIIAKLETLKNTLNGLRTVNASNLILGVAELGEDTLNTCINALKINVSAPSTARALPALEQLASDGNETWQDPLFEHDQVSKAKIIKPKRGGWPKGKPRKKKR